MARALVVEDDTDLRDVLVYNLQQEGHEVLSATTCADGLSLARSELPDVVLLDLMLPDGRGTVLCRQLKEDPETRGVRVVIVSALREEIDRVVGFELGADDYITKPFSVRELVLRVRAVLRRAPNGENAMTVIRCGMLEIDGDAHRAWVEGQEIDLTAIEFRLLSTLAARGERVQTRTTLLDIIWGSEAAISERTVDAHVKRLREKLGNARGYVETVRGVGYRMAAESRAKRA